MDLWYTLLISYFVDSLRQWQWHYCRHCSAAWMLAGGRDKTELKRAVGVDNERYIDVFALRQTAQLVDRIHVCITSHVDQFHTVQF